MAAFHGRQGSVYVDVSAGANGNAVSLALLNSWNFNGTRDKVEVTSFGDSTRTYVVGLADASIEFSGFVDDSSLNIYTIADGKARKFYLYNDQTRTSPVPAGAGYWYGTMYHRQHHRRGQGRGQGQRRVQRHAPVAVSQVWEVKVGEGQSTRLEDWPIADFDAIEKASGLPWVSLIAFPHSNAAAAEALFLKACERLGVDPPEVVTAKLLFDSFNSVDDDAPTVYEDGLPLTDAQTTDSSSGPADGSDGPPTLLDDSPTGT